MSFSLDSVRKVAGDPLSQRINELAKRIAKFEAQNLDIDSEEVFTQGDSDHSIVKFSDTLNFGKQLLNATSYYTTFEPDFSTLTCWLMMTNIGKTMSDYSGFDNNATINGDPCMVSGIDNGVWGGSKNSPAVEFDGSDYLEIADAANIQISGIATGISIRALVYISDFSLDGTTHRRICEKYDDANNGYRLAVTPSNEIIFHIKRAGTEYKVKKTGLSTNTWYDTVATYAVSGNVSTLYVNNVSSTTADTNSLTYATTTTLKIGTKGTTGHFKGRMNDFRIYKEKVLSSAEVGYLYTNKVSISNIAFGGVGVVNHSLVTS